MTTLPICRKDQVQPTKITTLRHHTEDFFVYRIVRGSHIIRAETQWVAPIGTTPREQFLVSVNRPEVRGEPIEMTRDPSTFEDHGYGIAYFSYETLAESKANEDEKSIVQAISEGYGHVVTFQVTKDLNLLAMDKPESRVWLARQMKVRNRNDLVALLEKHFSVVEGVGRNDSPDEDATIAQFICSELSGPYGLDGYGIHDGYPGFRPELALCTTLVPKGKDLVGLGGLVLKSKRYGHIKAKAVCVASIYHDSSKRKAETRREREEKMEEARKAARKARSRTSPKRGRVLDFSGDDDDDSNDNGVADASPPKVRRGLLDFGSPSPASGFSSPKISTRQHVFGSPFP